jgi:hypothetical protein
MYKIKYFKYKNKYLNLKKYLGGSFGEVNHEYDIPLHLLLDNPRFDSYLFTGFCHIDKTKITKITYKRIIKKISYERYNPGTRTYSIVETDERHTQFLFTITIEGLSMPIIVLCENSGKLSWDDVLSYRWIPNGSTNIDDPNLEVFIINGSRNGNSSKLSTLSSILGYLVNNNILLIKEKILNYDECPINLTKYDATDNIILLFPCLHTVSNLAYSTGLVRHCPICRSEILNTQSLTFEEFNELLAT